MNSVILEEGDLARVLERLKKLEESQKKSVESVLKDLQHLIRSPLFQKDQAIDYLVNLKIVAKETKHAKAGFYSAVLAGIDHKSSVFSVAYMGIIRGSVPRVHSQALSLRGLAFIIKGLRHLKNNESIDRIKASSQCF